VGLAGASLFGAHLGGVRLDGARLARVDLREAVFDKSSRLNGAVLTGAFLDRVSFDGANLSTCDWSQGDILGDEMTARKAENANGKPKDLATRLDEFRAAVRANRTLSNALRAQGLTEDADRFAYRAQILQREVLRRQGQWGQLLMSWFLYLTSGYGFRLRNILMAYGGVLLLFSLAFWMMGVHSFPHEPGWQSFLDCFLVSVSAVHGRTTFELLGAWSLAAWAAAVESVVGIVIEGVFVAMLIQRFFAR
jgi:hypothetical protein